MAINDEVWLAHQARADCGEGPLWDPEKRELVWLDIMPGLVNRLDVAAGTNRVIEVGQPVGAAALRAGGGLLLALRDGFGVLDDDGSLKIIAEVEADNPLTRMNDGKCDLAGRFWAGTMAFDLAPDAGTLYRFDADHAVTPMVSNVSLSNGLGWSPDDKQMYFIDSLRQCLDVFDFDVDTGAISNRRRLIDFAPSDGLPDGMTVDADGYLWVAMYAGSALRRYAPNGKLDYVLRLPVSQPTCCAFGGDDLRDLYITTASQQKTPEELAKEPLLGSVFCCRPGPAGRASNPFRG